MDPKKKKWCEYKLIASWGKDSAKVELNWEFEFIGSVSAVKSIRL